MNNGRYVTLSYDKFGNLVIEPTAAALEDAERIQGLDETSALLELLEDHLCNGMERIRAEEVRALTDATILGMDVSRNEDGEILEASRLFWFPTYETEDPVNLILNGGCVFIRGR